MSSDLKKPSRFGMLKGVREAAQAEAAPEVSSHLAETIQKDDASQEPFSCTLSRGLKRRLKKASADEARKQYLLVEQALEEYLTRQHPDIK